MLTAVLPNTIDAEATIREAEAILEQARTTDLDNTPTTGGHVDTDSAIIVDGLKWA